MQATHLGGPQLEVAIFLEPDIKQVTHLILQRVANAIVDKLQNVRDASRKQMPLALPFPQVVLVAHCGLAVEVVKDGHTLSASRPRFGSDLLDLLERVVLALLLVKPGLGLEPHLDVRMPAGTFLIFDPLS